MNHQDKYDKKAPIVTEYSALASIYDRKWSFYVQATVRETMARLSLPPQARVLDVGCGTGVLLEAMAKRYPQAQLAGVDPVLPMLAVARQRLSTDVDLCTGWAEMLPFGDETFDMIVSNSMFHYIPRPLDALREMRRVLGPDGELVMTDWCGDYLLCRLYDAYFRLFDKAHHKVYREHECIQLLEQAGYRVIQSDRYKIDWRWGLMTVRAKTDKPLS